MSKNLKPIEIKISTVVAVSVILRTANLTVINETMAEITGGATDYFDHDFAVIDVSQLDVPASAFDWKAIAKLLRSYCLNPVAVRNARPDMETAIRAAGLSLDTVGAGRAGERPAQTAAAVPSASPNAPDVVVPAPGAMIIDTPVRTGSRIHAGGRDLIVMATVNSGAEVIADGNIHIYAPLRGRALAGAAGDTGARIFTLGMEAELVAIAGIYRTFEEFPKALAKKAAMVKLSGERMEHMDVEALG